MEHLRAKSRYAQVNRLLQFSYSDRENVSFYQVTLLCKVF